MTIDAVTGHAYSNLQSNTRDLLRLKTPDKQRKEAERQRMKKKGLRRFEMWLHPEHWSIVKRLIERLNKKRM